MTHDTRNKPRYRFEVHTYTIFDGWTNGWTETRGDVEFPDSYATVEDATREIIEFVADIKLEISLGEREPDEGYEIADFIIYDNATGEYLHDVACHAIQK